VELVLSTIIIVGPKTRGDGKEGRALTGGASAGLSRTVAQVEPGTSLAGVDILGRSVTGRLIEQVRCAGVERISLLGNVSGISRSSIDPTTNIMPCSTEDAWCRAEQELLTGAQCGIDATLIVRAGAYADFELRDALQYHRDQARVVTRVFDKQGPLDIWIIDPERFGEYPDVLISVHEHEPAHYVVSGYVNRLENPRDLRKLAMDGLTSRCGLRPHGTQVRPGVWVGEDAQIHRDARIVAPAFIGRGARIAEQCLITRCSNIESNCHVDYGTVVEDSSILSNSYLGIGLDLSHAIVDGNNLLNLERDVTLQIADPCIIRQNKPLREETDFHSPVAFVLGSGQGAQAEEGSG
jgi:carbonic anhydrase/acetyltransferase-like protein (isoleucine patch superfamily)